MEDMTGRVLIWAGAVVALPALAGLGVYFWHVGLDKADKLSSVIGAFIAVIGLAMSIFGLIHERRGDHRLNAPAVSASGERSVAVEGNNSGIISTGDNARGDQSR